MDFDVNHASITYLLSSSLNDHSSPPRVGETVTLKKAAERYEYEVVITSHDNGSYKGLVQNVEIDGVPEVDADGLYEGSEVSFKLSHVFSVKRN